MNRKYLNDLKMKSFSIDELKDIFGDKVNVITYDEIINYDTIDDVMYEYGAIILYLTSSNYGHYVCIFKQNNKIQFFDSFGDMVDRQLKFIPEYFRYESGQWYPLLSKLLVDSNYEVKYNEYKLQNNKYNTCGRWCIYRLIRNDLNEREYAKIFLNKNISPDDIITIITEKL